mgnify:CR=1 FL=1
MNGFQKRTKRKKNTICQTALALYKQYGIEKVNVNDIAQKANVSPVTIYNYFGSKRQMTIEVMKYFIHTLLDHFQRIMKSDVSFIRRLEKIMFEKNEMVRLWHVELFQKVLSQEPEMKQFMQETYQKNISTMVNEFLQEGREQGYINPDLSQESLMLFLEMFRNLSFNHPEMFETEKKSKIIKDLMHLFQYGIMER